MSVGLLQEYVALMMEKIRTKKGQKGIMGSKFDLKQFKTLPDQRSMLAYASKFLQRLGDGGSSRTAFLLSSRYVLKIAMNNKGLAQNESELNVYTGSKGEALVTRVYGADEENRWLIVDLVKELSNPDEFDALTGTNWRDFSATIINHLGKKATKTMPADRFTQTVIDFCRDHDLMPGDVERIEHWGKTPDGRVVLLDYGLTEEVWDTHYKNNRMPSAKSAGSEDKTVKGGTSSDTNKDDAKTNMISRRQRTHAVPYSLDGKGAAAKKNPVQDEPQTAAPRKKAVGADDGTKPSRYRPDED